MPECLDISVCDQAAQRRSNSRSYTLFWMLSIIACLAATGAQEWIGPVPAVMLTLLGLLLWAVVEPSRTSPYKVMLLVASNFAFWIIAGIYLRFVNQAFPLKYDPLLLGVEQRLHLSVTFDCARLYSSSLMLRVITVMTYLSMAYVMAQQYGWHLLHRNGRPDKLLTAYILAFGIGPLFYLILPACGPAYAYPGFGHIDPIVDSSQIPLSGLPNCMPSLHMTIALVILMFRIQNRLGLLTALVVVGGTAFATLATGEHYLVDLIVAVPFALSIWATVERRWRTAAGSFIATLSLLLLIRFGGYIF